MAVDQISSKLSSLRASLRQLIIGIGCLRVLLVVLASLGAAFLLDWYAHLLPAVRISLIIAAGGVSLAAFYQYIVRPMGVKLTDDALALLVEKHHPGFQDRLISAVQLSRQTGGGATAQFSSSDLVQHVIRDANLEAAGKDFAAILRRGQLKRLLAAGIASLLAVSLYAAIEPFLVQTFAARMIHPFSTIEWPRKTTIVLAGRDKTSFVAKGDDVAIEARCEGSIPARVSLHYRSESAGTRTRKLTKVSERGFRAFIPSVSEEFSFYIEGGDHTTDVYKVKVIDRPGVETIDVEYQFPKYTGLPGYKQTSGQGDITGVVGTTVQLVAKANKPIKPKGAKITFDNKASLPMKVSPRQQTGGPQRGGSILSSELALKPGPTNYRIEVTDLDGLSDSTPVTYRVRVIVDNPPAVKVLQPTGNREVTAKAAIAVIAESNDERDFGGIRETRLSLKNGDKGQPATHVFADTKPRSARVQNKTTFDLSRLAPKEGDVIACYVEAEDFNDVTGPGIGRSDPFYLTIISPAQLAAKLDAKLNQAKKDIEDIQKVEDSLKAESDRLADKLRASQKLSGDDAKQLAAATESQRELGKRTTSTGEQFADVAREMAENKIGTPEDTERLNSFKQSMDAVGGKMMPQAAGKLADAQKNNQLPNLQDASAAQADALGELASLLKRMSRTEDLDELIRQAGRLVLKQKGINERSKNVSVRTLGQKPDEIAEADKAILRGVERDQSSGYEEMKSLESAMSSFVKNTAPKDPAAAAAVQSALEQAANDQIARNMKDVAEKLANTSAASAVPVQEKIYADLQKLVDNLNEAKRKQIADINQLKREMEAAAKELDKIIREQQAEKNATDPAGAKQLEGATQQLEKLIKEQEKLQDETSKQTDQTKPADLAAKQQGLAKEADEFAKQLAEMKGKPAEASPETKKAADAMSEAAEVLSKNQPGTAQLMQVSALDHLKKAKDALDKALDAQKAENLSKEQDRIQKETTELKNKLDALAEQSKPVDRNLSQRMQGAAGSSSKAQESMGKAGENIKKDDRHSAAQEQDEALKNLDEAKKKLDEAQRTLAKKEREQKLFEIGKALVEMLGKQREVNTETLQIDEAAKKEGELSRQARLQLQATAGKQAALKADADQVLKNLEKEEGAVFTYAMADVSKDMTEAAKRLTEEKTDWSTQQTQKDVERTLAELVESLKQEYDKSKQSGGGGGAGGGGGGKKMPLVPPLAQLKMLKTLEVGIFDSTKTYEEEKVLNRMNPVLLRKRTDRLGEKQEEVSKAAREFARKLDEAQAEAEQNQKNAPQEKPAPGPADKPEEKPKQ